MAKSVLLVFLFYSTICFIGCQKSFDVEQAIETCEEFVIGQYVGSELRLDTIRKGDEKWKKLSAFGKNNSNGWSNTSASYSFDYWARSKTLLLSGWHNETQIVLSHIDTNQKAIQMTKSIEKGELDFLTE
jgi:hypothetical protein